MNVLLDYRIEIPRDLARFKIRELKKFHEEGEKHFNIGFDELKTEVDRLTSEEWEEGEDYYIGLSDELESLRELKRNFATVGLFMVLEKFLLDTLQRLHWAGAPIPHRKPADRWDLNKIKDLFTKANVPITKPETDWKAIKKLQALRNCITHLDGIPDEKTAKKLKGEKFDVIEGVPIHISEGYVEANADLVQRHCNRIVDECEKAFMKKPAKS